MHMVFALLCFVVVIHWLIFPYPSGLLHWHCGNLKIVPMPAKQPWWIWINTSYEFIMNDCITTTKQSTTKPCAYFLGYTVWGSNMGEGKIQGTGCMLCLFDYLVENLPVITEPNLSTKSISVIKWWGKGGTNDASIIVHAIPLLSMSINNLLWYWIWKKIFLKSTCLTYNFTCPRLWDNGIFWTLYSCNLEVKLLDIPKLIDYQISPNAIELPADNPVAD